MSDRGTRQDPNTVWIIFDAEDAPLGLRLDTSNTLPVFEREEFAHKWLEESGHKEGLTPKAIPPAGLVLLCEDYGP